MRLARLSADFDEEDEELLQGGRWTEKTTGWWWPWLAGGQSLVLVACAIALFGRREPVKSCHPFRSPGFLDIDEQRWQETTWRPFDCAASHLMPSLIEAVQGNDLKRFQWLKGKTVLLIGDSVHRNLIGDFCAAIGQSITLFTPVDLLVVSQWMGEHDRPRANGTEELWREGRPRRCRIELLDFELLFWFSYGVATAEESASYDPALPAMEHYYPPAALSDRIEHLMLPSLAQLGRQPDLVELNDCLWSLRFVQSAEAISPVLWTTASDRMSWYRRRLSAALDTVEHSFPSAQLVYRQSHAIQFYLWFMVRVELNEAFGSAAMDLISKRPRFSVNPWGSILRGQAHKYLDGLHPNFNHSMIWADALLYQLQH